MSQDVRNCLEAGCDGHLAKPIKKQVLLDAIAGALSKRRVVANPRSEASPAGHIAHDDARQPISA